MKLAHFSILGLVFLQASCATLFQSHMRVVKSQPGKGGVIAIPAGMDNGANAKVEANEAMASNCGSGKFTITEEGEAVVGSKTKAESRKDENSIFGPSTQTEAHSADVTEWRITYACK